MTWLLEGLGRIGADPNDDEETRKRKALLVYLVVLISRATCELLKDEFVYEPCDSVAVKGKGEMETWYLVGRREAAPA